MDIVGLLILRKSDLLFFRFILLKRKKTSPVAGTRSVSDAYRRRTRAENFLFLETTLQPHTDSSRAKSRAKHVWQD